MTLVVCVGTVVFDFLHQVAGSSMPLGGGDRVVAIQTWDAHQYV